MSDVQKISLRGDIVKMRLRSFFGKTKMIGKLATGKFYEGSADASVIAPVQNTGSTTGGVFTAIVGSWSVTPAVGQTAVESLEQDDNVRANCITLADCEFTLGNFGFTGISNNVQGIKVVIEARQAGGASGKVNVKLSPDNGSTWSDTKLKTFAGSYSVETYGGETDTWGRAWSGSEFDNGNFLLDFKQDLGSGTNDIQVDYLWVTIYYK